MPPRSRRIGCACGGRADARCRTGLRSVSGSRSPSSKANAVDRQSAAKHSPPWSKSWRWFCGVGCANAFDEHIALQWCSTTEVHIDCFGTNAMRHAPKASSIGPGALQDVWEFYGVEESRRPARLVILTTTTPRPWLNRFCWLFAALRTCLASASTKRSSSRSS